MSALAAESVAELALAAGFASGPAVVAVAIARAESGWRPDAVGDVALEDARWGPSVGLWQVRTLKAETGRGTVRDVEWLLADPAHQAAAALAISGGGRNFAPWSTFTSLAYVPFMGAAQTAVNAVLARKGAVMANNPPPIVAAMMTPSGGGYLLVDAAGEVYAFGDARYLGGLRVTEAGGYEAVGRP